MQGPDEVLALRRSILFAWAVALALLAPRARADEPATPSPSSAAAIPVTPPPPPTSAASTSVPPPPSPTSAASTPTTPAPPSAAAAPGPGPAPVAYVGAPPGYRKATTWDLNVEGALGSTLGAGHTLTGFGRVGGGVLFIRDADVYALRATYEYSNLQPATFGVQAEYINDNSGLWVQLGGLLDTQPRPGAMVAVGYSIFGVEAQLRSYESTGTTLALLAKLRLPLGFLAYELRN